MSAVARWEVRRWTSARDEAFSVRRVESSVRRSSRARSLMPVRGVATGSRPKMLDPSLGWLIEGSGCPLEGWGLKLEGPGVLYSVEASRWRC